MKQFDSFKGTKDSPVFNTDSVQKWKIVTYLEPPKRPKIFTTFDSSNSKDWIATNLQPEWWNDGTFQCDVNSSFHEAYSGQVM